jgi:hypothetical protein
MKKLVLCTLVLIVPYLFFSLFQCLKEERKGFSIETISSELSIHPEWESRPLSKEESQAMKNALSQSYVYLGSGGQCDTFVSQDQKYVIKFFKQKKFSIPSWLKHFPLPLLIENFRQKKQRKKDEVRHRVFSGFKLVFEQCPQETGLLYLHFNPTTHLPHPLSFYDAAGQLHWLDLNKLEFIIQKKAELAYPTLDRLMANQQVDQAKQAIDQLLALNVTFYKKGFRNRDANFLSNWGFIDEQPILIDMGRVVFSEEIKLPQNYKKELLRIVAPFRQHLAVKHPELLVHLDQSIDKILQSD